MNIFARDVMTRDLVTTTPHTTLRDAAILLLETEVSGLPVVDENDHLVGIITEFSLLAMTYDFGSRDEIVANHMTRHVISVDERTLLSDVADIFIFNRIRRLPVTYEGRLSGIISRRDLMRTALTSRETCARPELLVTRHAVM